MMDGTDNNCDSGSKLEELLFCNGLQSIENKEPNYFI